MHATKLHKIIKCKSGKCEQTDDQVAVEARLSVKVNSERVLSLYCTPLMVRELVVGFVMTEGIAEGLCTERMSIVYGEDEISVELHAEGPVKHEGGTVTSGCVGGVSFAKKLSDSASADAFTISVASLKEVFGRFQRRSDLYDNTGCIHSAALADAEDVLVFAEDIGRHNAVDKAIGAAILEGLEFSGKMMLASGRLSSEIVSKCAKWGIPIVVSRAAPTARSLAIAEEAGLTVVGFLRGERFNIYTRPDRITGL